MTARKTVVLILLLLVWPETAMAQSSQRLRELLLEQPGSVLLSLDLVDALVREQNIPLAISHLGELLARFPLDPLLLVKRGQLRLSVGQLLEAREDFERALGREQKLPDALYGLIRVQEGVQDWERSRTYCQGILKDDPGNAFAVLHAAWACFQMKRFDEAFQWYSHQGLLHRREMVLGRGWTLIRLKDLSRARQAFGELTAVNPLDPEGLAGIREVDRLELDERLATTPSTDLLPRLREQGRIIEGLQLSEAVLAKEPMHLAALTERAILFTLAENWQGAEQCYSLLLKIAPKPEFLHGRMTALFALGRLQEAARDAREVLKTAPTAVVAVKIVADDFYALGKFEQALQYYEKLPEDLWAWQGKGWCHLVLGNLPLARKAFQDILARYPGNPGALEGLKRIGE